MAKTRVRKSPNANPDIFDVVKGVTEEDLKLTDQRIHQTTQDIKDLMRRRRLLVLQRAAQQFEVTGERSTAAEMLVFSSYDLTKLDPPADQEPAEAPGNPA